MRLGLDEQGVTEVMAAADQARGLAKLAVGLRLDPDILQPPVRPPLVPEVDVEGAGPRMTETFVEILSWARDKAIMADGKVTRFQKRCVAYAVAVNAGAVYMTDWYAASLRRLGLDDHGFLEVLAVVDYYNNLNTLADGMDIESDIRPYGTYE